MDQEILIENIGNHLDSLESFLNAIIIVSVAVAWAGIQRSSEIEILGTKFNRKHAFFALSLLYLIGNMTILILFLRIGDIVSLLDAKHVLKGISKLATHKWILNPFSYFGNSEISQVYSSEGYGLLIATWWLCNTCLSTLMDDKKNKPANILVSLFLMVGLASMFAINRVYGKILSLLKKPEPDLFIAINQTSAERFIGAFLGIIVGVLIFLSVNLMQNRWKEKIK